MSLISVNQQQKHSASVIERRCSRSVAGESPVYLFIFLQTVSCFLQFLAIPGGKSLQIPHQRIADCTASFADPRHCGLLRFHYTIQAMLSREPSPPPQQSKCPQDHNSI